MRKKIILASLCLFMLQLTFVFYDVRVSDAADLIVVANKNVKDVQRFITTRMIRTEINRLLPVKKIIRLGSRPILFHPASI